MVVSTDDARRLVAEFEAIWRRPPSEQELGEIIDATIREEVCAREALAPGPDRDDAAIRRRLQIKMKFLTESGAEVLNPDESTLQAHLDANADSFAKARVVALEQVMLEDADLQAAAEALALLRQGEDPRALGQPTMLPFETRTSAVCYAGFTDVCTQGRLTIRTLFILPLCQGTRIAASLPKQESVAPDDATLCRRQPVHSLTQGLWATNQDAVGFPACRGPLLLR
jgi:hypothetical protein